MGKHNLWFLMVLCAFAAPVMADKYKVISYLPANPPYNITSTNPRKPHQVTGIFADIFSVIGDITGDTFVLIPLPVARAHREFEQGHVDIEPGINSAWRQSTTVPGVYSKAYDISAEVIVFNRTPKNPIRTPQDLLGKRLGVVRGFVYPDFEPYFASGQIIRVSNVSQENLVLQLSKGRLQQIIMGKATVEYMIKTNPNFKNLVVGHTMMKTDVMMRVHPSKAQLLPRLNAALDKLVADGQLEKIYAKYR